MKILLIEDDRELTTSLKGALSAQYTVDVTHTGEEGEFEATENDYDIIILDLLLPDADGMEICKRLRKAGVTVPILILTGKLDVSDAVAALDAGADDYLTKPFRLAELQARLRALVRRRPKVFSQSKLRVGDLSLDVEARTVERAGLVIELRRKELLLLEYLMRNSGKVVTRGMILDHVWESSADPVANTIDVHINFLRAKVDRPFPKALIKTVHGLGYKIEE